MKRLLSVLLALLLLTSAAALAATEDDVRLAMQEALCDAAGAPGGLPIYPSAEDAALLSWMNCWFITITDDVILLETSGGSYLAPVSREDPVEVLAMTLACKAAFHDFVAEDVVVFVEWTGMESITVEDADFGDQVDILLSLGYDQVSLKSVLALRREIAAKLGLRVTDSSFTYYDRFVSGGGSGGGSGGYVPTKQPCFNCHTTGKCQICYGRGTYRNPYTGDTMTCTCDDGLCPTCDGEGYW